MDKLTEEYSEQGKEIHLSKTRYTMVAGKGEDLRFSIASIDSVTEFEYLGVTLTVDGRDDEDVLKMIRKGKVVTRSLHPVLLRVINVDTLSRSTKHSFLIGGK